MCGGEGLNYLRAHIHWLPSLGSGKLNSVCVWGGAELFTCYPVQGLGNSTVVLRVCDSYHVTSGVGDPVTWHSNTASVPTAADTAVNSDTNFGASVTGTQKTQNHAFNSSCNLCFVLDERPDLGQN